MDLLQKLLEKTEDCALGVLIMENAPNRSSPEKLNLIKHEITHALREKYGQAERNELRSVHPLDVYTTYYKKYGYSYHVMLQLAAIMRGKPLPDSSALVDAMFMAEMKNWLLTAGHDLDSVRTPLVLKKSDHESYTGINGKDVITIKGDFMIADSSAVISSILRGPDMRTCINAQTNRVLYTVYALPGIDESQVYRHLDDIESYVKAFADESSAVLKKVF